jgi:hypothetical protein
MLHAAVEMLTKVRSCRSRCRLGSREAGSRSSDVVSELDVDWPDSCDG